MERILAIPVVHSPIVAVVGPSQRDLGIERQVFEIIGAEICQVPLGSATAGALPEAVRQADAILHGAWRIDRPVIDQLERCRVIGRYGLGFDNIDVAAATARGIAVVVAKGYCESEMSDHALAFILGWYRQILFYDRKRWLNGARHDSGPIPRIRTLTAGLCGFGGIARVTAPKLQALGMTVIAFDPHVSDEMFASLNVRRVGFDELLRRADAISIHCALTPETHHLFEASAFARMKSTALLVNTARGGIVDTAALAHALETGEIAGACLDVLEEGAYETHDLGRFPSLLTTPHIAWRSEASRVEVVRFAAIAVREVLCGRTPPGLVNPEVAPNLGLAH